MGCFIHRGLDLVNVHLFHDASNLIACNASPSVYSDNRRTALRYVIDRSASRPPLCRQSEPLEVQGEEGSYVRVNRVQREDQVHG